MKTVPAPRPALLGRPVVTRVVSGVVVSTLKARLLSRPAGSLS